MAIYVYYCNARISFHNVYSKGSSTRALFVNCPSVICLPSMLYLYGETPLVNCGPRSIFLTVKSTATKDLFTFLQFTFLAIYFSATILHPLDTFNPLCSAKPVSLTTSLNSWGKVICCLCAGFHGALTPVEAPCHSQPATPSEATPFSYWSIKPWFLNRGKTCCCAHHTFSLGVPNSATHINFTLRKH